MKIRFLFLWLALCAAFFLTGCEVLTSAAGPALLERVAIDVSNGSGVSEASATAMVESLLPELVRRRGTVEFYGMSDVEGAVLAGRFVVGTPTRESRSAIAAFERDRLAEGKRTFLLLRSSIMENRPRTSPLALALTVMSMNAPTGAEVRYYLASDAREWSPGVDMECHPPTMQRWAAVLHQQGLLPPDSLRGALVTFVGVRPMMSVPGDRCPASLGLMNQTRSLWQQAITNAGGRVVFARDTDELADATGSSCSTEHPPHRTR
jgi:hypothetical protein